jgi:hypothetical protein
VKIEPGKDTPFDLIVRNFEKKSTRYEITIVTPSGLAVEPSTVHLEVGPEGIIRKELKLSTTQPLIGTQMVCFDITRDGQHLGPLFDMIVYPAGER